MRPYLLQQRFEQAAARAPQAMAVRGAAGDRHSYGAVEAASRALAGRLRAAGCGPGARVGVWMAKSPAAVVGLLAVLRAGGVYVPLDPGSPSARVARLAADCGLWGLLAEAERAAAARAWAPPPPVGWSPSGALFVEPGGAGELAPAGRVSEDLAYVLYTSG
ncbi:MAG TPA: AMP-binding protein, partial [Terriglobales bacterium]|nr:AMP-binding protein [Terriglobales bacterium]